MEIVLSKVSKRYGYQSILKDINLKIDTKSIIGLTGRNGSGKSTLMKIISSYLTPTTGKVTYYLNGELLPIERIPTKISFAAPYINTTQELTLREALQFHQKFKPLYGSPTYQEFLHLINLQDPKDKEIRQFSSGMKQKVNLAFAILSVSHILILDEPTSYLDAEAKQWYKEIYQAYKNDRTIIIASNETDDFIDTNKMLKLQDGTLING